MAVPREQHRSGGDRERAAQTDRRHERARSSAKPRRFGDASDAARGTAACSSRSSASK